VLMWLREAGCPRWSPLRAHSVQVGQLQPIVPGRGAPAAMHAVQPGPF